MGFPAIILLFGLSLVLTADIIALAIGTIINVIKSNNMSQIKEAQIQNSLQQENKKVNIKQNILEKFKTKDNIVLIDPVMGDYGKLYSTYTDEMCKEMQNLIKYADVLTPNLTELCRLLDLPYPNETPTHEELYSLCERLSLEGPSKIVITGLQRQGAIENFIFETDKPFKIIKVEKIGGDRSGTGDVFSSIVSASIIKGEDFVSSVEKATSFISKSLKFTTDLNLPGSYGVCFEEFLTELK